MNLNEVKKHVKFDIIFTLLVCIGVATCLLLTLAYIFRPLNVSASQNYVTTDVTNSVDASYSSYCVNGGAKTMCVADTQSPSWNVYSLGDNDYSSTLSFAFGVALNVSANSPSTLNIIGSNFKNVSYSCENNYYSCSVTYVSSTQLNINFTTSSVTSLGHFFITTNGVSMNNVPFNISQVKLVQLVGSNNTDIIDNATQNTNTIIENANSNTSSMIDKMGDFMNEFITRCNNLLDTNNWRPCVIDNVNNGTTLWCQSNTYITGNSNENGSISYHLGSDWAGIMSDYIPIEPGLEYYLSFNDNLTDRRVIVQSYDINKNFINGRAYYDTSFRVCPSGSVMACFSANAKYIRISYNNNVGSVGVNYTLSNMKLNTDATAFCPYGSYTNKIDEIGGSLGLVIGGLDNITNYEIDTYDFLSDDTQPTPSTSEIQNVLGLVSVNDPLSYLLTLPITLLNKINVSLQNTCHDFSIGHFGTIGGVDMSSYEFKFPCLDIGHYIGNSLWTTIDVIVGIGLLVVSISKFYHMIINMLSLGAEEKASKISHYFTPMEFLQVILEGDIPGVTLRASDNGKVIG